MMPNQPIITKINIKLYIFICLSILSVQMSFASQDTIPNTLSFDFGVTRGRNINIWPLFKRFKNEKKKELQILYPIYSATNEYLLEQKNLQILPFFISDSSKTKIDKRYLSLYYPSLLHYNKSISDSGWIKSYKFIELAPYVALFGMSRDRYGLSMENNLLFFIWLKKDNYSTKFNVFPLYFYREDPNQQSHFLFPLYYHKTYNQIRFKTEADSAQTTPYITEKGVKNVLFPIFWSKTEKEDRYKTLFPLIFYRAEYNKTYFNIFPFWWYKNDYRPSYYNYQINDSTRTIYTRKFFPIYFYRKQADSKSTTLFPVFYQRRDSSHTSFTIFPIYTHGKNNDGSKNYTGILPCYWHQQTDSTWNTVLFPLYAYGDNKTDNSKYRFITPLYYSFSNSTINKKIFFPILFHSKQISKTDTIQKTTLFPLYWSTLSNHVNNKTFFPIIFSFKDSSYKSLTILPLFSYGTSPNFTKKHLGIAPIYWHQQSAQSRWDVLFPIWWSATKYTEKDTTTNKFLVPFYLRTKSNEKNNTIIFPFIYSLHNGKNSSFTFFPFYTAGHRDSLKISYKAITPLYWSVQGDSISKKTIFPLFWQTKSITQTDTIRKTTLFPIYERNKSRNVSNTLLIPFYFESKTPQYESQSLFPIYSHGHSPNDSISHKSYGFLYWKTKAPTKTTNTVFPLWWSKTEIFAWNKDTISNQTLLPIFWKKECQHERYSMLFPLYMQGKSSANGNTKKYWGLTPLFWHTYYFGNDTISDKKKNVLFPIFWNQRSEFINYTTLFPLFFSYSNKQTGKSNVLVTPLIGSFKDDTKKRVFVFPFYHYSKKKEQTKNTILTILFRKIKRENYKEWSILWPICKRTKSDSLNKFYLAPILWYSKTDSSKLSSIQPLYYNYKSNSERTFILSWFIYKYQNTFNYSTKHSILWKLFEKENYNNGDYDTRVLHLLYANSNKDGKREKSLFPIYHIVTNDNGNKSKSFCLGFYNYFKEYRSDIKEFYEEDKIFWFIRLRSNYNSLKAKGYNLNSRKR